MVLEGAGTTEARSRSTDLTIGFRWQILWSAILFFVAFFIFSFLVYLPIALMPQWDSMWTGVALDCVLDVAFAIIQIVMFLYYWDAASNEWLRTQQAIVPDSPGGDVAVRG